MTDSTTSVAGNLPHAGKGLQGNSQEWVQDGKKMINIGLSVPSKLTALSKALHLGNRYNHNIPMNQVMVSGMSCFIS